MLENQSILKEERMDYKTGLDLLSELPLSIIHIILALVPIKDAVRTSVLSSKWRYTWATLPHLVFEDKCESSDFKIISEFEKHMRNSITHALFHHKGPIHKFKIAVPFQSRCPDIDEWVLHLSRNGIKELILDIDSLFYPVPQHFLSSIYSCEKLTDLKLINCELDPPPSTFKGFLFLRGLNLQHVKISPNEVESLVANSPLLERFSLRIVFQPGYVCSKFRISSSNLKDLDIMGDYTELCVSAPLLAGMSVILLKDSFTAYHQQQKSSICNYTDFMGGFANLERLAGDYYFRKYLRLGIESCHDTLVFQHLKHIIFYDVSFEDVNEISDVARLIIGAPNLHGLRIIARLINEVDDALEAPHVSFRDFGCVPSFKLEKLRHVTMSTVRGTPPEMELIKFLLESSPVLESMRVSISPLLNEEKKQNVAATVRGLVRASRNAALIEHEIKAGSTSKSELISVDQFVLN